jgi:DNA modification methylase
MALNVVCDHYALYNDDCIAVMGQLPPESVHLSIYSPPFRGLYIYSSDPRDLSNALNKEEFLEHYAYVVKALHRITIPGRIAAVHCADVATGNTGRDHLEDFPGDLIRVHKEYGWDYIARYHVWKEPLGVRNRTMMKSLTHKIIVDDATRCSNAGADYCLIFRRDGDNPIPVEHPSGLLNYAGDRQVPYELHQYRNWQGDQIENKYSHWIWRQYASAFWDDVRIDRVLPYREAKEEDDERHMHPLQLDAIERLVILWSNPGEVVFTPFMGVGSEVYGSVLNGRKGIGVELKTAYYQQAVRNVQKALEDAPANKQQALFAL